eukprot:4391495-Amphidinium_carterae.1
MIYLPLKNLCGNKAEDESYVENLQAATMQNCETVMQHAGVLRTGGGVINWWRGGLFHPKICWEHGGEHIMLGSGRCTLNSPKERSRWAPTQVPRVSVSITAG